MTAVDVAVYQPDGTTLIAAVPRRREVRGQEELNTPGVGSFQLHLDDAVLAAHPTLLAPRNVVTFTRASDAVELKRFRLEEHTPLTIDAGEKAARTTTVNGRGLLGGLQQGVVAPLDPDLAITGEVRVFNYASPDPLADWGTPSDWTAALGVQWDTAVVRHGWPKAWSDRRAKWIWPTDPTLGAAVGPAWFRKELTLTVETPILIQASADNRFEMWLAGVPIMSGASWRQVYEYTVTLPAGTYLFAARVDNGTGGGLNPAGLICSVAAYNGGKIGSILLRTDTTWLTKGYGDPPVWSVGGVLAKVITEAQDRDVTNLQGLTLGFDKDDNSNGDAWSADSRQEFTLNLGDDVLKILDEASELATDVWTDGQVIQAAERRGTDLTATVVFADGDNVLASAPTFRSNGIANAALVRYGALWMWVEDTVSIAAEGRYETFISLPDVTDPTQAVKQVLAAFVETGTAEITIPLTVASAKGPVPMSDFNVGDLITGPGLFGEPTSLRVMSIAFEEIDGYLSYDLECYPEVW